MSSPPPLTPEEAARQAAANAAFQSFATEAWALLGVGLMVTIIRTYGRIASLGLKGLRADDYLAWVGAIFYAIETSLAYSVGNVAKGFANNGMTDAQRASLSPDNPEYGLRVIGSKIQLCGWSSYSVLMWSLKASLMVLYDRLTTGLGRSYKLRVYVGFTFLIATWIAVVLNLFFTCRPFHKYWQIYPDPGNVCQPAISNQIIWTFLSLNVATDLYLLCIPIPMLWASSIKPIKKIGLMILFSGGLLVITCAILRVIMIVIDPVNGAQSAGSWAVSESFVAVVTTNLPLIFPLLKTWTTTVFSSLRTTQIDKTPNESRTFGSGNPMGSGRRGRLGRGPPTANPITNATFSESEERMVNEYQMENLKRWKEGANPPPLNGQRNNVGIRKDVEVTVMHQEADDDDEQFHRRSPPQGYLPDEDPQRPGFAYVEGTTETRFGVGGRV
ncbi:hypothetical protein FQN55_000205 [Onygenales sp. PD_40]|nr:hypothetical protein FQN55_000205 [Onygenales sp. PD_40]